MPGPITPITADPGTAGTGLIALASNDRSAAGTGLIRLITEAAGGTAAGAPGIWKFDGTGDVASWSADDLIAIDTTTVLFEPTEWDGTDWTTNEITLPGAATQKYLLQAQFGGGRETDRIFDFYNSDGAGAYYNHVRYDENTKHGNLYNCAHVLAVASGGDVVSLRCVNNRVAVGDYQKTDSQVVIQKIGTTSNNAAVWRIGTSGVFEQDAADKPIPWADQVEAPDGWTCTIQDSNEELSLPTGYEYEVTVEMRVADDEVNIQWYETGGVDAYQHFEFQPKNYSVTSNYCIHTVSFDCTSGARTFKLQNPGTYAATLDINKAETFLKVRRMG